MMKKFIPLFFICLLIFNIPAATAQQSSFDLGTDCILGVAGAVSPVVATGLKIIDLAMMGPEGTLQGYLMSLPLGSPWLTLETITSFMADSTTAAKNQVFNEAVKEVAKQDPILGTAIDACTNAREKFVKTGDKKIANIEVDKEEGTVTAEINGIAKEDGAVKVGNLETVLMQGTEVESGNGISKFTFSKKGTIVVEDFTILAGKGESFEFDENTGLARLSEGSIEINGMQYMNLADAKFKLGKDQKIEFADFDVKDKCAYENGLGDCAYKFEYNNEEIVITAKEGGHVTFDPVEGKKIGGKGISVIFQKKDILYGTGRYEVTGPENELIAIYFSGEEIKEKNGVSFSSDFSKISVKGAAELNYWVKVDGVDALKFGIKGKENSLSEILRRGNIDSIFVKQGSIIFTGGAVITPKLSTGTQFMLEAGNYVDVSERVISWGGAVNNEKKKAGEIKTDIALLEEIGKDKFEEYISLRKEIYDAKGDLEKLKALAKAHPDIIKEFPELKEAIEIQEKQTETEKKFEQIKESSLSPEEKTKAYISEYKKLTQDKDEQTAIEANAKLGLLYIISGDRESALSSFRKLKSMATDPDTKKFAEFMDKKTNLELFVEYNEKAFNGDKNAADKAKEIYDELGGNKDFKNVVDEITDAMDSDLSEKYGDSVPANIRGELDNYRKSLLSINSRYVGLSKEEIREEYNKELMKEDAKKVVGIKQEYVNLKKTDATAAFYKREDIYKNDEVLQKLEDARKRADDAIKSLEGMSSYQKKQFTDYNSLKGRKESELIGLEIEIAKRKNALTGDDLPALQNEKIFDIQGKISEIEKTKNPVINSIPIVKNIVYSGKNKEISELSSQMEEAKKEWNDVYTEALTTGAIKLDDNMFNPNTGKFGDSGEALSATAVTGPITDVLLLGGAGKFAQVATKQMITVATGKRLGLAVFTKQGMQYTVPRFVAVTGTGATAFHTYINLANLAMDQPADFTPAGYADSLMTFSILGASSLATKSAVGKVFATELEYMPITKTGRIIDVIAQPTASTVALTGMQVADQYLATGKVSSSDLAEITLQNAALVGALEVKKFSSTFREAMDSNFKYKSESIELRQEKLNAQAQAIAKSYKDGILSNEEAKRLMAEIVSEASNVNLEYINEYKEANQRAFERKAISKEIYDLNEKALEMHVKETVSFDKQIMLESNSENLGDILSRREGLEQSKDFLISRKEALKAQKAYFDEALKQEKISGKEYGEFNNEIKRQTQEIADVEKTINIYEKPVVEAEIIKEKGPDATFTKAKKLVRLPLTSAELYREARFDYDNNQYGKAEKEFAEVIKKSSVGTTENRDAMYLLAKTYFKEGKYKEAIEASGNFLENYPMGEPVGILQDSAEFIKAESEASLGQVGEAITELRDYETKSMAVPADVVKLEEAKIARGYLEKFATEDFIDENFRAIGVPDELIMRAIENPSERYGIAAGYIKEPAIMMGGLPSAPAEVPAIAPEVIEKSGISQKVRGELRDYITKNVKDVITPEYFDDNILNQLILARQSRTEKGFKDAKDGIAKILESKKIEPDYAEAKANLAVERLRMGTIPATSKKIAQLKEEIKEKTKDIIPLDDDTLDFLAKAYHGGESVVEASDFELTMKIEKQSGLSRLKSYNKANDIINRLLNREEANLIGAENFEEADLQLQLKEEIKEKTKDIIPLDDDTLDFLAKASRGGDAVLRASDFELTTKLEEQEGLSDKESADMANHIISLLLNRKKVDVAGVENLEDIQPRTGLKVFYTVQGLKGTIRLLTGEGDWPTDPTRAHMGQGVYAWNNLDTAEQYLKARKEELKTRDLGIVAVVFYEDTLKDLNALDLTKMSDDDANAWLKEHSLLDNKDATPADYEYVIRGVSEKYEEEHYFPVDIFKDYAGVIIVE